MEDLMDWDAVNRHREVVHDASMSDETRQRSRDALLRIFYGSNLTNGGADDSAG